MTGHMGVETVEITGVPERRGAVTGRPYRVWGAEHGVPWRWRPRNGSQGWATCPRDGWTAATSDVWWDSGLGRWVGDGRIVLNVYRVFSGERHPLLDKTMHGSVADAELAGYLGGVVGLMVYDWAAGEHGLLAAVVRWEDGQEAAGRLAAGDRQTCRGCEAWASAEHVDGHRLLFVS